jgi:DNA-binding response OmpR family regulator
MEYWMPKRIMVVDDDKEVQEIVAFVLHCNDFEVISAFNGKQMQRQLAEHFARMPDLIILDVMMPGEDGYRIFSDLRHNPQTQHIPVIIITAHTEDIYQRVSVDLGAALHLTKPCHPVELAEKVKVLLDEGQESSIEDNRN